MIASRFAIVKRSITKNAIDRKEPIVIFWGLLLDTNSKKKQMKPKRYPAVEFTVKRVSAKIAIRNAELLLFLYSFWRIANISKAMARTK